MAANTLTLERAQEFFSYDPDTGEFHWKARPYKTRIGIGDRAGTLEDRGYYSLCLGGRRYKAHRVAWLMMTGAWPDGVIDHLNGITGDNRFCNLRDAVGNVNIQNQRKAHSRSKSGLLGTRLCGKRWQAKIHVNGVDYPLGLYSTAEDAHAAYVRAKRVMHPGNTL